ncbi:S ribonuclease [Pyrus ussuriensis x Pyrus communis]|uniref:S ribonuclease n=1 Tax=Pyrus ussuriensis x Pyrus communis TaxID=2448454 RepID=A0A5N5I6A6_9ROSA|nr:S ribonuclease [Pyrus ussuriensis x Pyrus communis]
MLGSFSVKSRHPAICPEVFAEGIRDSPTVEDGHSRATLGKKKTEHIESSDTGAPRQGNIWCPSFLSSNGPLTGEDSVMKDATTATVVAKNLLTLRDNRLLSRRSYELAVQESLALSVQCAGSVSNMGQRLLARTRQVESLMAEVENLRQEIRQLKRENKDLHMLANNYSTSMKRKLDQLQEYEGRIIQPTTLSRCQEEISRLEQEKGMAMELPILSPTEIETLKTLEGLLEDHLCSFRDIVFK